MLPAMLIVAGLFVLIFIGRLGAVHRAELAARWPALLFAGAAILLLARGAIWPGIAFAAIGALAWMHWPRLARKAAPSRRAPQETAADREARAVLGVGATASAAEIRAAYRAKMSRAHPDLGGTHAEAARLAAARDRLLKQTR